MPRKITRKFDIKWVDSRYYDSKGRYDAERAVLPAIVYAGHSFKPTRDRIDVIGIGWWAWGIRIRMVTREAKNDNL